MNSEQYVNHLINSVPDQYPHRDNLIELNAFFKNRFLEILLNKLKIHDHIKLAVIPTYSVNPLIIKAPGGEPVIIFDHILMLLAQIYFRSLLISSQQFRNEDKEKLNIYMSKVYSVIIKIFNDKDNFNTDISEIISIEKKLNINGNLDERNNLIYTGFCMNLEQFVICHELIHIRSKNIEKGFLKKYVINNNDLNIYQFSHENLLAVDVASFKWYNSNRKSSGMSVGLNETLSTTSFLHFYSILALLEKNASFPKNLPDFPLSINRLDAIYKSLSIINNLKNRKIVKQEIELVNSLPDNNYISLLDTMFGAFFPDNIT